MTSLSVDSSFFRHTKSLANSLLTSSMVRIFNKFFVDPHCLDLLFNHCWIRRGHLGVVAYPDGQSFKCGDGECSSKSLFAFVISSKRIVLESRSYEREGLVENCFFSFVIKGFVLGKGLGLLSKELSYV